MDETSSLYLNAGSTERLRTPLDPSHPGVVCPLDASMANLDIVRLCNVTLIDQIQQSRRHL